MILHRPFFNQLTSFARVWATWIERER